MTASLPPCDGIAESDRPLPGGWLALTAVLAVVAASTWLGREGYRVLPGSIERYVVERTIALETGVAVSAAELTALAADRLSVQAGSRIFADHCARCHGPRGQGQIGPNLTDGFWLGDGTPLDVYATIVEGRLVRGMPSWGSELGPGRCKQVTAFVLTLRDTDVPGRGPEGTRRAPVYAAPP